VPRKLGQHFLKNQAAIKKIVAALELRPGETALEVGTGHGELTTELLKHDINLIAVEKDKNLTRSAGWRTKVKIIEGDILKILPPLANKLQATPYKLVGNIPYYLTGYLLRLIGELEHKPSLIVFTLQKEVAERIAAQPPQMNKLAASVQFWAEPEIIDYLKPGDFSPPPKVHSAIIRLLPKPYPSNITSTRPEAQNYINRSNVTGYTPNPKPYYKLVNLLFRQPRKTIFNNLRGTGLEKRLPELGLTGKERPQNLSLETIHRLARLFH